MCQSGEELAFDFYKRPSCASVVEFENVGVEDHSWSKSFESSLIWLIISFEYLERRAIYSGRQLGQILTL